MENLHATYPDLIAMAYRLKFILLPEFPTERPEYVL